MKMQNVIEKSNSDGILKSRHCHICNGDIHLYAPPKQIYCGEPCVKVAKLVSQRVIRQKDIMKRMKAKGVKMTETKTCRDCEAEIASNRLYCTSCQETRRKKAKLTWYNKKKGREIVKDKTCVTCKTLVSANRTYCKDCSAIRRAEVRRASDKKLRERKNIGQGKRGAEKPMKKIDPKWLVRGNISNTGNGTCINQC